MCLCPNRQTAGIWNVFLLKVNEEQACCGASFSLCLSVPTAARERENSCVSPGLASGVEGRKLPQRQKGQPGFDSGPAGVDLWEDAPNLPPHREPSARKVSGRLCSGLSEERGMRAYVLAKQDSFQEDTRGGPGQVIQKAVRSWRHLALLSGGGC